LSERPFVTNYRVRLYPSFNPMNSPTHSGNPLHGNLLLGFTTALAALAALSLGPDVRAPQNPFSENFLTQRATVAKAASARVVESSTAFPPFPKELKGVAPGPGYAWVPGYYSWTVSHGGHHWAWFRGHYENPPRMGAIWVAPHFEDTGSDRIYVGGYWRQQ
jgi:hypothetical protein